MTARTPTALKILNGSDAHHPERRNPAEPKPDVGAKPPPWLPRSGPARRAWRRLAPILTATRILTVADAEALALVCTALADYLEARADANGWRRADAAAKRYAAGLAWFGMNPSARTRVTVVPVAEHDPVAEWIASGTPPDPPPAPRPVRRKPATPADSVEAWLQEEKPGA